MRVLILHSCPDMAAYLGELLKDMQQSEPWSNLEVTSFDGEQLTQSLAVSFLKQSFDLVLLNLRLPKLLSLRVAELARLSKSPTKIFLISAAPVEFGPEIRLFDAFLAAPFEPEDFQRAIHQLLNADPRRTRRSLPDQEHLDAAIFRIFFRYRWAAFNPHYAFCVYLDSRAETPLPIHGTLSERLDFFAQIPPLWQRGIPICR